MPAVDPDKPVTRTEYEDMKADALEYGTEPLATELAREDRAFLIYEVNKYEELHKLPRTFPPEFLATEYQWWHSH